MAALDDVRPPTARPAVALQLWTVREEHDADPAGVLAEVARIGYDGVEVVNGRRGGLAAAAYRRALDAAGLRACGLHALLDELDDDLDAVLETARTLGTRDVVCAWVPPERRGTRERYLALAELLAGLGQRCRSAGVRLHYHHHDFELAPLDGRCGLDLLWETVDAELLYAEIDTYWAAVAGVDPAAYVAALGPRCLLLHVKDLLPPGRAPLAPEGEGLARLNAEVGTGVLDLPGVIAAARSVEWLVVEQDFAARSALESARVGHDNLRALHAGSAGS